MLNVLLKASKPHAVCPWTLEFRQVEALIPAAEAVVVVLFVWWGFCLSWVFCGVVVALGFFLPVYKHTYIKEMNCSSSLE